MIADSKYCFERKTGLLTSYILQSVQGAELPNFPATYRRIPKNKLGSYPELKGKRYILFSSVKKFFNPLMKESFDYCLSLAYGTCPIGLNFPNETRRAATNNRNYPNRNDTFLIEFSDNWNSLTIYVFFEKGNEAEWLFEQWNAGEEISVKGAE